MYPKLFPSNATSWASMGIGILKDAIRCDVEENRNGSYELEMEYPISGAHYADIALRSLIVAKPNFTDDPQPFRVYNISKPLNGVVTINAQHISYDLSGFTSKPFVAPGLQTALVSLTQSGNIYPTSCPFSFSSDMSSASTLTISHPVSTRAIMGGIHGSLIDVFGGEWHYDGYQCELLGARGTDRGVSIRYGRNLTDLKHVEEDKVYTAVYPYYYNEETGVIVTLPEQVLPVPGTFTYVKVLTLDLSDEFQEAPTQAQLRSRAQSYINQHTLGANSTNITLNFVQLDTLQDRVDLCDTVSVYNDKLGVYASAKCIRTVWDVLRERYKEVELGNARNSIASTIARIEDETVDKAAAKANRSAATIAKSVAEVITGNAGGYVIMHDTNDDGEPDEILIMDTDDIQTAVKVIRMNNAGIAFSKTGYAGTYSTAWNINGEFVADFIATGQLKTASVEIFGDAQFYWDAANITIVDPNNSRRMIRLGKYDGTNYGLGFSYDGGRTWQTGMDFDGIQILGNVKRDYYAKIDGDSFDIMYLDQEMVHLGIGSGIDENGNTAINPYYTLGARAANSVVGNFSLAVGKLNTASNYGALAVGDKNEASGLESIALGGNNKATKTGACAIGSSNTASGFHAFACNSVNTASGDNSVAMGNNNKATGKCAFAVGVGNIASGNQSVALGHSVIAAVNNQLALGVCNVEDTTDAYVVVIGNGTQNARKNILTVNWVGSVTIAGTLTQNSDKRLKTIIGKAPDLSGIRAVAYRWRQDVDGEKDKLQHIGYIAQDVEPVAPYLVGEDANGYKTLDYIGLLCAKVDQLERKVAELERRLADGKTDNNG